MKIVYACVWFHCLVIFVSGFIIKRKIVMVGDNVVLQGVEPFLGNDFKETGSRDYMPRETTVVLLQNGGFYGDPCRGVIRRATGARARSWKRTAVQSGLESRSRESSHCWSRSQETLTG
jgi:hypothetical protein